VFHIIWNPVPAYLESDSSIAVTFRLHNFTMFRACLLVDNRLAYVLHPHTSGHVGNSVAYVIYPS